MIKEFYDKDRKKIVYDLQNPFAGGLYGRIYKLSDSKCIKIFLNNGYRESENSIEDLRAFEALMGMSLSNFYEIYKILYDNFGFLTGYTMSYYNTEDINLLGMPMDYLLDNFNSLFETMLKISKNGINMTDLHRGNILLTNKEMIIVDADEYHYDKSQNLTIENKKALYNAFRDLLLSSLSKDYKSLDNKFRYIRAIDKLFNIANGPKDINKKLTRYKRPIDYLHLNLYK